jgi:transcriptional regulator with XRE-family HTH domain
MINPEDFIKRLEYLLDFYNLNASSFADKIGVQRSSLSHLLSGRNKPSLDFIMKILEEFPDVDLYWILKGKGSFLKNSNQDMSLGGFKNALEKTASRNENNPTEKPSEIEEKVIPEISIKTTALAPFALSLNDPGIFKIVIFYKDGTFRDFNYKN